MSAVHGNKPAFNQVEVEKQLDEALQSPNQITLKTVIAARALFEEIHSSPSSIPARLTEFPAKITKAVFEKITRTGWMAYFDRVASAAKNFFRSGFSECVSSEYLLLRSLSPDQLEALIDQLNSIPSDAPAFEEIENIIKDIKSTILKEFLARKELPLDLLNRGFSKEVLQSISTKLNIFEMRVSMLNKPFPGVMGAEGLEPETTAVTHDVLAPSKPPKFDADQAKKLLTSCIGNLQTGFLFQGDSSKIQEIKALVASRSKEGSQEGFTEENFQEISDQLALLEWGESCRSKSGDDLAYLKQMPPHLQLTALKTYLGEPEAFLQELKYAAEEMLTVRFQASREQRQFRELEFFSSIVLKAEGQKEVEEYVQQFIKDALPYIDQIKEFYPTSLDLLTTSNWLAFPAFPFQLAVLALCCENQEELLNKVAGKFMEGCSSDDDLSRVLQSPRQSHERFGRCHRTAVKPLAELYIEKMCQQESFITLENAAAFLWVADTYDHFDSINEGPFSALEKHPAKQSLVDQLVSVCCNQYKNNPFVGLLWLKKTRALEGWKLEETGAFVRDLIFQRVQDHIKQNPMTSQKIREFYGSSFQDIKYVCAYLLYALRMVGNVEQTKEVLKGIAVDTSRTPRIVSLQKELLREIQTDRRLFVSQVGLKEGPLTDNWLTVFVEDLSKSQQQSNNKSGDA